MSRARPESPPSHRSSSRQCPTRSAGRTCRSNLRAALARLDATRRSCSSSGFCLARVPGRWASIRNAWRARILRAARASESETTRIRAAGTSGWPGFGARRAR